MHGFGPWGDVFFTTLIILTSPITYVVLAALGLSFYLYKRNKNKGN